jgi:hypothetical protein
MRDPQLFEGIEYPASSSEDRLFFANVLLYFCFLTKDIGKAEPFLLKYGLSKTWFVVITF